MILLATTTGMMEMEVEMATKQKLMYWDQHQWLDVWGCEVVQIKRQIQLQVRNFMDSAAFTGDSVNYMSVDCIPNALGWDFAGGQEGVWCSGQYHCSV